MIKHAEQDHVEELLILAKACRSFVSVAHTTLAEDLKQKTLVGYEWLRLLEALRDLDEARDGK